MSSDAAVHTKPPVLKQSGTTAPAKPAAKVPAVGTRPFSPHKLSRSASPSHPPAQPTAKDAWFRTSPPTPTPTPATALPSTAPIPSSVEPAPSLLFTPDSSPHSEKSSASLRLCFFCFLVFFVSFSLVVLV